MESSKQHIENAIDRYRNLSVENEYILNLNYKENVPVFNVKDLVLSQEKIDRVSTNFCLDTLDSEKILTKNDRCFVFKKDVLENLSPDNIDINYFWEYACKKFPLFSISLHPDCKSIPDVNKSSFVAHKIIGAINEVALFFEEKQSNKILEIGPGYGNFLDFLKGNFYESEKNYYAIDVNPLFNFSRLYKCNGKEISFEVGIAFDLIYSINVFQHLSKNQRSSYYKNIFNILNPGGKFIFSMFLIHPDNQNGPYWSFFDENGRAYYHMLGQYTEIDTYNEINKELKNIGFDYKLKIFNNLALFVCTKQNK